MTVKVLLVDTFNLIRRVYEAGHSRGEPIETVIEASRRSLEKALRQHAPSHGVAVVDSHEKSWRHLLSSDYKSGRTPTPEALLTHLNDFNSAFASLGIASLMRANIEADDIIGTLARGIAAGGGQVVILSTDKGFLPLLSDQIQVFHHFEQRFISISSVQERFDLRPEQLVDFWALAGDPTNGIKGVPRVGRKTAIGLLKAHDSLVGILKADASDPLIGRIQAEKDLVLRCRLLVNLKTDLELGVNLKSYRLKSPLSE